MKYLKKLVLVACLWLMILPAQAGMISTPEFLAQPDRAQLVDLLQREDVQHQLIKMGVDPAASLSRVNQMTDQEVASLQGQIANLPVGAGISTIDLLLIIIVIILIA